MLIFKKKLPLSLYIHIPWCVRKCPYCDFNSHEAKSDLPQVLYVNALIQELDSRLHFIQARPITSIFFGGGTPSLFSAESIGTILEAIAKRVSLEKDIEITLEANPGTIDETHFSGFKSAGINRLSIGIQSFQDDKLKTLGRIHNQANALRAVNMAHQAGFENFNLDIMYGLPNQTIDDALHDIETALALQPTHFSWYQLTIEPNTVFYKKPPRLPADELIWNMQCAGQALLQTTGFHQYEVSAYSKMNRECLHNKNYWEFGDYLGIGAGAHSKMTQHDTNEVIRFSQVRHPKDYLDANKRKRLETTVITEHDIIFEFMLNALRLTNGFPTNLFTERTGLPLSRIQTVLSAAIERGLLLQDENYLRPSTLGKKFLNDLTMMFL